MTKKRAYIHKCVDDFRLRAQEVVPLFPLPALIGFGLTAILTSQLLPGLNPRLGQPARLISFDTEREADGAIWMSISIDEQASQMVITTSDRKVLRFDSSVTEISDFQPLVDYLQDTVDRRLKSAVLARSISTTEITAVMAVDETVKFALVRPVINALAMAGISDYAFETVIAQEL